MADQPIGEAPCDLAEIAKQQSSLILPHFTSDDAFTIGLNLRTRLRALYPSSPTVISISHVNSDQILFQACSGPGVNPDNEIWVARKRKAVKRFGMSSWALGRRFDGDEALFATKLCLGPTAGEYAIHGGGVPVKVKGVEGVVAVIVVSGLQQDKDHMVVVEALQNFIQTEQSTS